MKRLFHSKRRKGRIPIIQQAINLNGTGSLAISSNIPPSFGQNFCLEFWIKPNQATQTNYSAFIMRGTTTAANGMHIFGGNINWRSNQSSGAGQLLDSFTNYPVGIWTHIAFSVSNNNYSYYRNGELIISGTVTATSNTSSSLSIGDWASNYGSQFNGALSDFRIWNTSRSQIEIQRYRNNRLLPAEQAALVVYLPLKGVTDLTDKKNNYNASMVGNTQDTTINTIYDKRILVQDSGIYKRYDNGWLNVPTPPSDQDYIDLGMEDVSVIPESAWNELSENVELCYFTDDVNKTEVSFNVETEPFILTDAIGNEFDVLYYTDDPSITTAKTEVVAYYSPIMELDNPSLVVYTQDPVAKTVTMGAIPKPRIAIPNYNLGVVGELNNFIVALTETNKSLIRILVSDNNGTSWKSYYNDEWIDVDINNHSEVEEFGLTAAALNSITTPQWNLLSSAFELRFSYYFNQHDINDNLSIQTVSVDESIALHTPVLNSLSVSYKKIDENYSGLMFMDESEQFFTTSIGELIKYLDMGSLIAGQTSLEVKVKLANTLPFPIENLVVAKNENLNNVDLQISYSNTPFISVNSLSFEGVLNYTDMVEFYVRVSTNNLAVGGGNFEINAQADPVMS